MAKRPKNLNPEQELEKIQNATTLAMERQAKNTKKVLEDVAKHIEEHTNKLTLLREENQRELVRMSEAKEEHEKTLSDMKESVEKECADMKEQTQKDCDELLKSTTEEKEKIAKQLNAQIKDLQAEVEFTEKNTQREIEALKNSKDITIFRNLSTNLGMAEISQDNLDKLNNDYQNALENNEEAIENAVSLALEKQALSHERDLDKAINDLEVYKAGVEPKIESLNNQLQAAQQEVTRLQQLLEKKEETEAVRAKHSQQTVNVGGNK